MFFFYLRHEQLWLTDLLGAPGGAYSIYWLHNFWATHQRHLAQVRIHHAETHGGALRRAVACADARPAR